MVLRNAVIPENCLIDGERVLSSFLRLLYPFSLSGFEFFAQHPLLLRIF